QATNHVVGVQVVSVGSTITPRRAGGANIVTRNASDASTNRNCTQEPAAPARRGLPAIATAPLMATSAENTSAAPGVVTIMQAVKCASAARKPNWSDVSTAKTNEFRRLTTVDDPSRRTTSAVTFAPTIVLRRSGSCPRTIASRRSKLSASHAAAAISPTVTIEYATRIEMNHSIMSSALILRIAVARTTTPGGG